MIMFTTSREKICFGVEKLQAKLRDTHLKVMLVLYNVSATVSPWTHYDLVGMLEM